MTCGDVSVDLHLHHVYLCKLLCFASQHLSPAERPQARLGVGELAAILMPFHRHWRLHCKRSRQPGVGILRWWIDQWNP